MNDPKTVIPDTVAPPDAAPSTLGASPGGALDSSVKESVYPSLVSQAPAHLGAGAAAGAAQKIGKYLVTEMLGQGAQGEVYRALHPGLSKEVVIKRSRWPLHAAGADLLAAEARLLAELDHPNLARVYDLDVHDGCPYLVMEFVRGCHLEQFAQQHCPRPRQAAVLVARLARALAVAHRRGIIHQDIKPRNILIDEAGQPRLIDFGLASWQHAWAADTGQAETISGTPAYMAPEQARGERERVDQRSDIFALGGVLYFLLVGKAPFGGREVRETLAHAGRCDLDKGALLTASVPRRLKQICMRALAAEPAERYATAESMAADLERFVRRPRQLLFLAAGLAFVALVVGIAWGFRRSTPPPFPTAAQPLITLIERPVGGEVRLFDDLRSALPLRTGDKLQLHADVPHGFQAALYWRDTEGAVAALPATQQAAGAVDRVSYPRSGVVPLQGAPGTEFVLLCAGAGRLPGREEMQQLLTAGGPWPRLPAQAFVLLSRDQVEVKSQRGLGNAPERTAVSQVQERVEQLREQLRGSVEYFVGVAFSHQD